jgi:hypothetical protein
MIFLQNKYTRIYFQLIEKRQNNILLKENVYCERHHIIPKSLGGTNDDSNLVNLLPREHFIAHLLLTKMVVEEHHLIKMHWALHKMCYGNTVDYFGGKDYQWYREKHIKFLKEHHPSKKESWKKAVSERVLRDWENNIKRRESIKDIFKKWREENPEKHIENCRRNAKLGGIASKEKLSKKIEYKGEIFQGWNSLLKETGISKHLYQKYYLKGFDPCDRIKSNGPVPKKYIHKQLNDKENQ